MIESGRAPGEMPSENSVMSPFGVMRPMALTSVSENQTLPSGPRMMPSGPAFGVGSGNSAISPFSVMRPILFAAFCANQRLPSAPTVMPIGVALGSDSANSVNAPLARIEPADLAGAALAEPQAAVRPFGADIGAASRARDAMLADA